MLYLFLWLLCALTAAYMYRSKGRSWWMGMLAGLVFGPIGVVLVLLTITALPPIPTKQCPKCGSQAPWTARICGQCGADIHYA